LALHVLANILQTLEGAGTKAGLVTKTPCSLLKRRSVMAQAGRREALRTQKPIKIHWMIKKEEREKQINGAAVMISSYGTFSPLGNLSP
jgi:hypothetical protein